MKIKQRTLSQQFNTGQKIDVWSQLMGFRNLAPAVEVTIISINLRHLQIQSLQRKFQILFIYCREICKYKQHKLRANIGKIGLFQRPGGSQSVAVCIDQRVVLMHWNHPFYTSPIFSRARDVYYIERSFTSYLCVFIGLQISWWVMWNESNFWFSFWYTYECFTPTKKNIAKGTTDPVHWELWLNQLFDQNFIACWSFRFEQNVLIPHR